MGKYFKGIYDINFWYGVNNSNPVLTVSKEDLKAYMSILRDKSDIIRVFVSNYLSYYYDPICGDNLLTELIKENKELHGVMVFPNYFISREEEFENYLISRFKDGFRMLRLYRAHKYELKVWAFNEIYSILNKHSFPIILTLDDIDITENKAIDWSLIYEIATEFENIPIILDGGNSKEMMYSGYIFKLLENCKNIYIETHNLLAFNQIEDIVEKFGSERLIFGSFFPNYSEYLSIERIKFARISDKGKKNILFLNLKEIIEKTKI